MKERDRNKNSVQSCQKQNAATFVGRSKETLTDREEINRERDLTSCFISEVPHSIDKGKSSGFSFYDSNCHLFTNFCFYVPYLGAWMLPCFCLA